MNDHALPMTAIITSAAFVNAEIAAEFGRLPPSFLPLAHRRLFAWQVEHLRIVAQRILLSLPESFEPSAADKSQIAELGVEIIYVADGLSLGVSLAQVIVRAKALSHVIILHGDTLLLDPLSPGTDYVSLAQTHASYEWGVREENGRFIGPMSSTTDATQRKNAQVLTGLFAFSSGLDFSAALMVSKGDFIEALNLYAQQQPLAGHTASSWLDFGHLQKFYQSRASMTTARAFNDVSRDGNTILKAGTSTEKLRAEAAWFNALPPRLRLHTPPFLGEETLTDGSFAYRLGYEFSPTLHELFVFGALVPETWLDILGHCFGFLRDCAAYTVTQPLDRPLVNLLCEKTQARLDVLRNDPALGLLSEWRFAGRRTPSPKRMAELMSEVIAQEKSSLPGIMHGDFCFTNIFYDFRQGGIKVIDPRGSVRDGEPTIYGDVLYDLAKLNHSIEGYDLILAGRFALSGFETRSIDFTLAAERPTTEIAAMARDFDLFGYRNGDPLVTAMTAQLFLAMLPFHADRPDRQRAFLANAMRLFLELDVGRR